MRKSLEELLVLSFHHEQGNNIYVVATWRTQLTD